MGRGEHGKQNLSTVCQNCGATLQGEYCHVCGQAAKEPRRAVVGLVQDVFVETLAIDGKLARTLFLLLWRPATLARLYLDGKRVRFSPPFRLYLFASVFFFFALFGFTEIGKVSAPSTAALTPEERAEVQKELDDAGVNIDLEEIEERADGRPFTEIPWEEQDVDIPPWLEPHIKRLYEAGQRAVEDPRLFISESRQNIPRVLLLAPLIYGALLTLLYFYRRKFFVYDHFIVSLYMHAALYAYLLLTMIVSQIPVVGMLGVGAIIIWALLQPLLVFRQAYGSNWISAAIKWTLSNTLYLASFVILITLGVSYSLYNS